MKNKSIWEITHLWEEEKQSYVKQSTLTAYVILLQKHILPAFGNNFFLKESEVQHFVLDKMKHGLSRKSVKDILTVLKMIKKYGERKGFFEYSIWNIKLPMDHENKKLEILTIAQEKKLLRYLKERFTFKNFGVYLCLNTGMRIGEVCALTWGDIDMDSETIAINKSVERIYAVEGSKKYTELKIVPPKTKNSNREIPISDALMRLIRPLKKVVCNDFYVLTNESKPIEPRTYRNYFQQLMRELNIPMHTFHGLRHTFATRCIESQCDYKTVSVILGHSNINTTLNLYVHPNEDQKKRCINKMLKSLNI